MMLAVREAGKTLNNAVAEVREAVDFCRYYAGEAENTLPKDAKAVRAPRPPPHGELPPPPTTAAAANPLPTKGPRPASSTPALKTVAISSPPV